MPDGISGATEDRLIEVIPATFFYEDAPETPYRGITVLSRTRGEYRITDYVLEDAKDRGEVMFSTKSADDVRREWEENAAPLSREGSAALLTEKFRDLQRRQ